jgi:lysophospholipid acyltransferase (LPLAT)-like uncharacterized protein
MLNAFDNLAYRWGKAIARYGLHAMSTAHVTFDGEVPPAPFIGIGWHSMNMLALASMCLHQPHSYQAFIPPGLVGATMRGWLEGGCHEAVLLPEDGLGNPQAALKHMARALNAGNNIVIAVDGPHGPAFRVRPGALWLARLTGAPLFPTGYAATPAIRWPRWDHHLVPLPGARIVVIYGPPIHIGRTREIDDALLTEVANVLNTLQHRAQTLLDKRSEFNRSETIGATTQGRPGS